MQHDVQLYGPGDVVGVDPRAVVRTDPRSWITNFDPNYLVSIEFYDEDFPWRYSPDVLDPATGRLRPWLTLVVLTEDEFADKGVLPGRPLPFIEVKDLATLPPPDQLGAWAHVHSNRNVTASDTETVTNDMAAVLPRLAAVLAENPDLACSRILCPRHLDPEEGYHAFLVPAFETGRLAGLGHDPAGAPGALALQLGGVPEPRRERQPALLLPLAVPHGPDRRLRVPCPAAQAPRRRRPGGQPGHGRAPARLRAARHRRPRGSAASSGWAALSRCRRAT